MGDVTSRSNRARTALSATVLTTAAATFLLTGCGDGHGDRRAYCTDQSGKVLPDSACDTGHGGSSFIYVGGFGGHSYRTGQTIPRSYLSGSGAATRVNPSDPAARAKAGLPKTGPVKSGTRISGGIGTGKAGGAEGHAGSAKGGSGGG